MSGWGQDEWPTGHFNEANARRIAEEDRAGLRRGLSFALPMGVIAWVLIAFVVLLVVW